MAQSIKDSFLDLEKHRKLLEDNVEKLRKSLIHWQTWEAEYEGLKEEILAIPTPTQAQLVNACRDYQGDLVTQKEVAELLGVNVSRTPTQVVNLLDRRLDYVEQNVQTAQKQLDAAKHKLAIATVVSEPDVMNEDGLPIMEILEELDEEGNAISGRVSTPGDAKPQLLEVLKKAGISLPAGGPENISSVTEPTNASVASKSPPTTPASLSSNPTYNKPKESPSQPSTKRAVAFAEDTKDGPIPDADSKSYTARRLEAIMARAEEDSQRPFEPPVVPENESPEDAALRRQMLHYGLSEVGAVVAELDLEDGEESDWTEGEDWDEDETDDEDQYGRSTGRFVDDELKEKMLELERKLGFRAMENVGKNPDPEEMGIVQEGIGRITINREEETPKSNLKSEEPLKKKSSKLAKKSVQFAQELDIAPPKSAPVTTPVANDNTTRKTAPISDIIERTPSSSTSITTTAKQPPKKQSRFKSSLNTTTSSHSNTAHPPPTFQPKPVNGPLAHPSSTLTLTPARPTKPKPFSQPIPTTFQPSSTDNPRTVPTGPENAVLAPTIIERDTPSQTEIREPDEFDSQLLNQEVAVEYHKMRNKFIGRAGGFMKEEEEEIVPLEEEEGGPKRVSRFKAARLGL